MENHAFTVVTPRGPIAAGQVGDGPAIVLLAGVGSTSRIWGDLPRRLSRAFTVISIDNRGVGGSRSDHPFNLDETAADVAAVLDHTRHSRAALVGASMGGVIALTTAVRAPDRVQRLVVASAAAHLSRHGRRSLELVRDLFRHLPPDRVGAAMMTLGFAPPFHEQFGGFVVEAADLYGIAPEDLPGAIQQVEHLLAGWDLRPKLDGLTVPTLVIGGERDPLVAPEDTADLAATLPNARLVQIPNAAHSVLAEGGTDVFDEVVAFLQVSSGEATKGRPSNG